MKRMKERERGSEWSRVGEMEETSRWNEAGEERKKRLGESEIKKSERDGWRERGSERDGWREGGRER